jgi:hypothetical protein
MTHEITQPKEKGEFTVVLQTVGGMKIEVIREVRSITVISSRLRQRTSLRAYRGTRPKRSRLPSKRRGLPSRSSVLRGRDQVSSENERSAAFATKCGPLSGVGHSQQIDFQHESVVIPKAA